MALEEFDITATNEYQMIQIHYKDRVAGRSGVPLMNHIDEGIVWLGKSEASPLMLRAFCIHPMIQAGDVELWMPVDLEVLQLASMYVEKANTFLCRPETDHIQTSEQLSELMAPISTEILTMLLADKVQNYKDFLAYHMNSHPRRHRLNEYFVLWIMYLENELFVRLGYKS